MNVFILGFTKCGTTSVYDALARHPKVSAPRIKEPHLHFSKVFGCSFSGVADNDSVRQMFVMDESKYREMYDDGKSVKVDGSAMSVCSPEVMRLIRSEYPDAKAIIMMREVVGRAFSAYSHMVRDARESKSFGDAIAEELSGKRDGWLPIWDYVDSSRYVSRVKEARDIFGSDLLLIRFSDYIQEPSVVMDRIAKFIGVDPIEWSNEHSNMSGVPRFKFIQRLVQRKSFLKSVFVLLFPRPFVDAVKSMIVNTNVGVKPEMGRQEEAMLVEALRSELELICTLSEQDRNIVSEMYSGIE